MSSSIKDNRITKNTFLLFSPFLILFIILVLIFPTNGITGDEDVYLGFAKNLVHGFYSPPSPDIGLTKGPGYPLLLAPFVAFHLPLGFITLLNAVFYYLSIILLFKSLQRIVTFRIALVISLFWACFLNLYDTLPFAIAEVLSPFLVSFLLFSLLNAFDPDNSKNRKKHIFLSGFIMGYLVLTKPIFGYVLICMLVGSGLLWIFKRHSVNYKKGCVILLIALATTFPYLIYTYHLTGRILYWGTSGGNNMYWMSTPYRDEYGSWINYPLDSVSKTNIIAGAEDSIIARHQKDFEEISKYRGIEQDDAYKRIALRNIKSHPGKYVQNCLSNIGRIIFNYPFSYRAQKPGTLIRFPFTGILAVLLVFCLIPTVKNWKRIDYPVRFLLLLALIYFGGSIFASAETRMLNVIAPILLFYVAYVLKRTVKISFRFNN